MTLSETAWIQPKVAVYPHHLPKTGYFWAQTGAVFQARFAWLGLIHFSCKKIIKNKKRGIRKKTNPLLLSCCFRNQTQAILGNSGLKNKQAQLPPAGQKISHFRCKHPLHKIRTFNLISLYFFTFGTALKRKKKGKKGDFCDIYHHPRANDSTLGAALQLRALNLNILIFYIYIYK